MTEPVRGSRKSTPFGQERDPLRIVAFSDAVIAIAVTLLVLEIRPPQDTQHMLHGLVTLWPSYLAYACHDRRLLAPTIDSAGMKAIGRRFRLALGWIATAALLGALLPALGVAVIIAFIIYYWTPISGEIARGRPRRHGGGQP
jgi:hypothetical protein